MCVPTEPATPLKAETERGISRHQPQMCEGLSDSKYGATMESGVVHCPLPQEQVLTTQKQ